MEQLLRKSRQKIENITLEFKRYLFYKINFKNRLISIAGSRGTGKTTLLLQIAAVNNEMTSLYVALDDLFFTNTTLYNLAEDFYNIGGNLLLLDEVHKYPDWSRELKLIYDDFPDLHVIFSSSSILDIYKGESDLSRRTISYVLKEMSFREYILFYEKIDLPQLYLDDMLKEHESISVEITKRIKPLKYFTSYLKHGAYPFYNGNELEYYQQILNVINLILDIDLPAIKPLEYSNIAKLKKLLYLLSVNVPFIPNISKLSEKVGLTRNALVLALQLLNKAELIHILYKQTKSISILNKPDKIWLNNPNLSYALSYGNPDKGNLRESFFISQINYLHEISLVEKGDFIIDNKYVFELGGKNKKQKQIQGIKDAFVVKDDIDTGVLNIIPLWLFGFLY
ncbi:MAG: AAA family ATPase [Bacteroidales bacterium]|nr:AAA family ATPase [Bacteroidales bacterium]MDD3859048.1 AAA family ATPase [Bacteroidales bacterium]